MRSVEIMQAAAVRLQANETAKWAGCVVLLITLALFYGLIQVGKRLKRSEANRKCLLSYMCFAIGWLLYAAIAAISFQTSRPMFGVVVALVTFAGFGFAGVTLAILGLSEVRHSPDLLKEGRGTAILTLVLSSVVLVLFIGAFSMGVLQGMGRGTKSLAAPGAVAAFNDLGFSIQPPAPWVRVDASRDNPALTAAFHRTGPEGALMVIAERIPAGSPLDFDALTRIVRDNLGKVSRGFKVVDEADEAIGGLAGRRLIFEANIQGTPRTFLYWLYLSPDVAYQLVVSADSRDASVIVPDGRKAFASFVLLQPK